MKTKLIVLILNLALIFSCTKNNEGLETVNVAKPQFMSLTAFRSSVKIEEPKSITESGKIYAFNNLVLVNDVNEGIHIIDNSNPNSPKKIAFIKIIANKDMEIKDNYLYADSLMDLLVFDISDLNNIKEVSRLNDVFPTYIPMPFMDNLILDYNTSGNVQNGVIVKWTITQELRSKEEINTIRNNTDMIFTMNMASAASTGQGGSLARFKIVNEYLYAVDSHNINIFNIQNLNAPSLSKTVFAGYDIETIFYNGNNLFLGSMSGMYVYNIEFPNNPQFISEFKHGTACDPVVVDEKYAYITLRAGNNCGAFESSLQIVDISNIEKPFLVKSYAMVGPYGLGVKDEKLFICDGDDGLKVYDKTDISNLKLLNHFENINTYDVIPMENHLLMIGDKILYQYKYSNNGITLLSEFKLI
ncbi:hypothetical protein [Lutibacter sp.]|uniref:LVIVD repeat-containing protein n=1 Tax=Lutibacter sp. TaxID=1925666 RepID=UPI001A2BA431|nr:hypothetical protein [Lutibacter sp.]MBI9040520.1 hypothetical protein [Lutibacter sp.]